MCTRRRSKAFCGGGAPAAALKSPRSGRRAPATGAAEKNVLVEVRHHQQSIRS